MPVHGPLRTISLHDKPAAFISPLTIDIEKRSEPASETFGLSNSGLFAALEQDEIPYTAFEIALRSVSMEGAYNRPDEATASIDPEEIMDFADYPFEVQKLIHKALQLTELNLNYLYGSADPGKGGMDCSGAIYFLLRQAGLKPPRQANSMYRWAWQNGRFHAVISSNQTTFELSRLHPGDLLFWTGTYAVDRDPPVTHVMLYLGRHKASGNMIAFGSSNGRVYQGIQRNGVSVFDFRLTPPEPENDCARFIGYASIPGLSNPSR